MKITEIQNLTSASLINLVASYGIGKPYSEDDKRSACVAEHGTFSATNKSYVKIIIRANDENMYDYGIRLWCEL